MADVKQTITGDSSSAQKAYADLARQVTALEEKLKKMGTAADGAMDGKKQGGFNQVISEGVRQTASMVTQWVSLAAVIGSAKQELEEFHAKNTAAANTQISVADSQAAVIKNLASATTGEKMQVLKDIANIQKDTGFPSLQELNRAAAAGASASAGNIPATIDAVKAAAMLTKDSPQDLPIVAAAALDLQKASGINDARKNLGFLMQMGTEARVVDLKKQAENIAPAVAIAAGTVTSDRVQATKEAGALFAALSSEGVDPSGETTRNAVSVITGELRSFFTEGVKVDVPGRSKPILVKPKEDPNTIAGRLEYLQENEFYRKAFMKSANFGRERFRIPFEGLVNKGQTDTRFRQALKNANFDGSTVDAMEAELKNMTPQLELAQANRRAQADTQIVENNNTPAALRAEAKRIRDEALAKTRSHTPAPFGLRYLTQRGIQQNARELLSDGPYIESSIKMLKEQQDAVRFKRNSLLGGYEGGWRELQPEQLNTQDRNDYEYLGKQIEILNKLMEQQNRLMEEDKRKAETAKPTAAPAVRAEQGRHSER